MEPLPDRGRPVRVAFVYRPSWEYWRPGHTVGTRYEFFFHALARSKSAEVGYFGAEDAIDAAELAGKWDVILCTNSALGTPRIANARKSGVPVIAQTHDPHLVKELDMMRCMEEHAISCCFGFMPEPYFHRYFPKSARYEVVRWGLEPGLFERLPPFGPRIKDRVLLTGELARRSTVKKIVHALSRRGQSEVAANYRLRRACAALPGVDYSGRDRVTGRYRNGGAGSYAGHLSGYRAAIAATGLYPTAKYWETPAAGCLTFMEVNGKNGAAELGYSDMESAVFIDSKNYGKRISRYLETADDPSWARIAEAGRRHAMENLNNDRAVERLVQIARSLL